jgi:hypothetical protein
MKKVELLEYRIEDIGIGSNMNRIENVFEYYSKKSLNNWKQYSKESTDWRYLLYKSSDYIIISNGGSDIALLCNYGKIYKSE